MVLRTVRAVHSFYTELRMIRYFLHGRNTFKGTEPLPSAGRNGQKTKGLSHRQPLFWVKDGTRTRGLQSHNLAL